MDEMNKTPISKTLEDLSAREQGLTREEVKERTEKNGYNDISEKKQNPLVKFLTYFWGPIPWMIEIAAILSAVIHHWDDFVIIFVLLLLNAVVGFWQEHKAGNAIDLLKKRLAPNAKVLRDGKWDEIPARELVPGDVVRIRLGDIVPADIQLMSGDYIQVDESALTGESIPAEKYVEDITYSGAIIRKGEMDAIVTSTGMNTYFGRTAKLVAEAKNESHFQKAVMKIGNYLIVLAVFIVAYIFLLALFRHEGMLETMQFALVLLVAAIPAALPAVLSVTMAVGATALAKKEAIVSKLTAIEELAGMDILCSDKTGTITKNELTVAEVEAGEGYEPEDVLLYSSLASREEDGDAIDTAIITKTKERDGAENMLEEYKIKEFKPFDPVSKRTEAVVEKDGEEPFTVAKGAPQVILALATDEELEKKINERVDGLAGDGYRALAVAKTGENGKWEYVGLIPLYDPPREDSAETIKKAGTMGVGVKMITGDHIAIAKQTAHKVGLGSDIRRAETIQNISDIAAKKIAEEVNGFAEVYPEHKYHIVEILQEKGHILGMTGDGVNDAPALKKADAGIAVDGATDAAKSAADIVLTRPGLSVIIDAIIESRKIFQRMKSYAIYRIAETLRVLLFITLSITAFNFYPVTAIMIVMLALFNDAPIMAIAYDNVKYSQGPEKWNMREILSISTLLGVVGVIVTFSIFYIAQEILHLDKGTMQAFIFLKLAVAGHLTVFMTRTRGHFWSIKPAPCLLWSAVVTKIIATLVVVYGWYMSPIGWKLALFVWAYALVELVFTDQIKVWFIRLTDHSEIKFKK